MDRRRPYRAFSQLVTLTPTGQLHQVVSSPTVPSYAICTTPRTASTFLCRQLQAAGIGDPDEWLHQGRPRAWSTLEQLWDLKSANGIFGVKLFWAHREDWAISDFDDVLPYGGRWVFLRREDLRSQALSLLTALYNEEWEGSSVPYGAYRQDLVARTEARLSRQNADWQRWFRWKGIDPVELTMESVVADPAAAVDVVRSVLRPW